MNRIARSAGAVALPTVVIAAVLAGSAGFAGAGGNDDERAGAAPTTAIPNLPSVPGSTTPSTTLVPSTSADVPTTAGAGQPTPGYVRLVDNSGLLNVEVPDTWTDVDLRPSQFEGGPDQPTISASPNEQSFLDTFDTPGVFYVAFPAGSDHNQLLALLDWPAEFCQDGGVMPYNDGVFVGSTQTWTACGGGTATATFVAADAPDNSFTAWLFIQTVTPADQPAQQHILDSFNYTPGAAVPTSAAVTGTTSPIASSVPPATGGFPTPSTGVPTTPTTGAPSPATTGVPSPATTGAPPSTGFPSHTTVPGGTAVPQTGLPATTSPFPGTTTPTTVGGPGTTIGGPGTSVAPGFQVITDDTGLLSVQVPTTWTDVQPAPQDEGGVEYATIYAAPDLQVYSDTFDGPGLYYHVSPNLVADPMAEVGGLDPAASQCTDGGSQPLTENPAFTGAYRINLNCQGTQTDLYLVVANLAPNLDPSSGTGTLATVILVIQVTDADTAALQTALATFSLNTAV